VDAAVPLTHNVEKTFAEKNKQIPRPINRIKEDLENGPSLYSPHSDISH
jgi:hypothetical protein